MQFLQLQELHEGNTVVGKGTTHHSIQRWSHGIQQQLPLRINALCDALAGRLTAPFST